MSKSKRFQHARRLKLHLAAESSRKSLPFQEKNQLRIKANQPIAVPKAKEFKL